MWLDSRFRLCSIYQRGTLLLTGGEAYGAPFLVERLAKERNVAWIGIAPADAADPIAVGNRLADAVNSALGGELLQHALPFLVHLRTLEQRKRLLSELTLVVSGAQLVPDMVDSLSRISGGSFGLWLLADEEIGADVQEVLGPEQLRVTEYEARELGPAGLTDDNVLSLLEQTNHAYTQFLQAVHEAAGLPDILVPAPEGPRYVDAAAREEDPEVVLEALIRLNRWEEALEIAVEHLPWLTEELLVHAGPAFQQQGLFQRLYVLLTLLPEPYDRGERVLEWKLLSALPLGEASEVLPWVRRHLAQNEAPELRSRYAGFLPPDRALAEAERAVAAARTPLTLWQYGRLHPEPETGIELLLENVSQSELENDAYACARAAGSLSDRYAYQGDYRASASWADWGLRVFDEHALKDGVRRLRLFNGLASARLYLGESAGLRERLTELHEAVEGVIPDLTASFRATLAELERVEGDPKLAAELTRVNVETASRGLKGLRALQHVRSMLELGRIDEAEAVAEAAAALSAGTSDMQDLRARLGMGLVQAFTDPQYARITLEEAFSSPKLLLEHRLMAALHYLLITPDGMEKLPEDLRTRLPQMSETALRVLSGPPEVFHPVWRMLAGEEAPALELKVLGRSSARLEGKELKLTKRQAEILLSLALHPDGLDYDTLHAFMVKDDDRMSPGTLRSHVSHLRDLVPVSDSPYRIEVPFTVDMLEVQSNLRNGKLHEALAQVGGPVLPKSNLPGIREVGEQFEEELRESVLASEDVEALHAATALWDDDLEVWEAALGALHPRDPRVPLVRARVHLLRREYGEA